VGPGLCRAACRASARRHLTNTLNDPRTAASGGLPIRQNRQLPKARHGAGARPVHCEFLLYLINVHVFVKQYKLVDLVQYIVLVELKVFFCFYCITVRPAIYLCLRPKAQNIVIRH